MSSPATTPARAVHRLFDVAGRHALVTGAGRGIGRALAEGLLGAGVHVTLNGLHADSVEQTAAELREGVAAASGAEVRTQVFDVTDPAAVAAGVAEVVAVAPLDILVNNVGMQLRSPLADFPDEGWDKILAVNLTSAFLVGREVARTMIPRGRGRSSTSGRCSARSSGPASRPTPPPRAGSRC